MTEYHTDISSSLKRWRRFRSVKRGYYAFLILIIAYVLSLVLPLFIGRNALIVKYKGELYFPVFSYYPAEKFGQDVHGEANYRLLKEQFGQTDDFVLLPLYPYGPEENLLSEISGPPPHKPSVRHPLGTDDRGRDVLSRLAYGFNISMSFALLVAFFAYVLGVSLGAVSGFYGGRFDTGLQRLIEIWATLPFLYIIIIISSVVSPGFFLLTFVMVLFNWAGITYYVRGEFLREKARDYVASAVSAGASDFKIIFRHIMPNALTAVITFFPFAVIANISVLVALDFLGFGLPPPTPSWGQLIQQGMASSVIDKWWLVLFPLLAQFISLLSIVFIGEAVREAFDPKEYSRLK